MVRKKKNVIVSDLGVINIVHLILCWFEHEKLLYVLGQDPSIYHSVRLLSMHRRCSSQVGPSLTSPLGSLASTDNICIYRKKGKRKVQGVPQSQTTALPRPQEEEETDKSKQAQTEKTYEKH